MKSMIIKTKECLYPGEGGSPQKSWVQPTSQNPYPIYDHNLRFSLPSLWPGKTLDTLFVTVAAGTVALKISYEGLLLIVLLIMMKE